jgi:hypothetical protein
MHSTDDTAPIPEKKARWKKCPICWDTVYMSETRAVRWYTGQESPPPREGDDIVLRLVMRQPGSTLALPRDGAEVLAKNEDIPWYFAAEVTDYARIMKGSEEYMVEQYDAEIEDLQRQENEDELMFGEEPEWTRKAVNAVREAKEKIKGIGDPPAAAKQPAEKPVKRQPIQFTAPSEDVPGMYYIQHAMKSGLDLSNESSSTNSIAESEAERSRTTEPKPNTASKSQTPRHVQSEGHHHPDTPYFFYQGLLHYYLAPLDIRILKSAFGNFASFPSTLLPRVERVSTGHIMDDDLRKRTKYLSHLPHGCEVGFLECNWTDVVSPEILDQFKDEIEKRRKRNREKENREERDRVRAEKAEDDARWAMARRKRPSIPSESFATEDFHALAATSIDSSAGSPPWTARQGSAFATLASPSTSPGAPRTVWGTALVTAASPELKPQHAENDHDDGWLHSWEQELLAENEQIALNQAMLGDPGNSSQTGGVRPGAGQGKKKKAKKITLMSTNARRAA